MNASLPRKKILAVDDSITIRKTIEMVLGECGYEVALVEDGAAAFESMAKSVPDLILLDFILPDMRGTDFCQKMSTRDELKSVPVLLISGNGTAIRQVYQSFPNVIDYLTKPFPPGVLKAVVSHVLAKEGGAPLQSATPPGERAPAPPPAPLPAEAIKQAIERHLTSFLATLPKLETDRGAAEPGPYYAAALSESHAIEPLLSELTNAGRIGGFSCPTSLVPLDNAMRYLQGRKASGVLRVAFHDEVIRLNFDRGAVNWIDSNNPAKYCQNTPFDFRAVPPQLLAEGLRLQTHEGIPIFVLLHKAGVLNDVHQVSDHLTSHGQASFLRAFSSGDAELQFNPTAGVAIDAYRCSFSIMRLLLLCYRKVDRWSDIEAYIPHFDLVVMRHPDLDEFVPQMAPLLDDEEMVLELANNENTVQEIIDLSGLNSMEVCKIIFRFHRINLLWIAHSAVPRQTA